MSSPLKQNTTALQELLDKINQLPEAGSGGGLAPNERAYQFGNAVAELNTAFTTSATGANG